MRQFLYRGRHSAVPPRSPIQPSSGLGRRAQTQAELESILIKLDRNGKCNLIETVM